MMPLEARRLEYGFAAHPRRWCTYFAKRFYTYIDVVYNNMVFSQALCISGINGRNQYLVVR